MGKGQTPTAALMSSRAPDGVNGSPAIGQYAGVDIIAIAIAIV